MNIGANNDENFEYDTNHASSSVTGPAAAAANAGQAAPSAAMTASVKTFAAGTTRKVEIDKYTGSVTAINAHKWLSIFESGMKLMGVDDDATKLLYVRLYLTETAGDWFHELDKASKARSNQALELLHAKYRYGPVPEAERKSIEQTYIADELKSFEAFKKAFITRFARDTNNAKWELALKTTSIRNYSSVTECVQALEQIWVQMYPPRDEKTKKEDLIWSFAQAPEYVEAVFKKGATTYLEAYEVMLRLEQGKRFAAAIGEAQGRTPQSYGRRSYAYGNGSNYQQRGNRYSDSPRPAGRGNVNAIESGPAHVRESGSQFVTEQQLCSHTARIRDSLSQEIQELKSLITANMNSSGIRSNDPPSRRADRDSASGAQRTCYRCNRPGHIAADCPDRGPTRSGDRDRRQGKRDDRAGNNRPRRPNANSVDAAEDEHEFHNETDHEHPDQHYDHTREQRDLDDDYYPSDDEQKGPFIQVINIEYRDADGPAGINSVARLSSKSRSGADNGTQTKTVPLWVNAVLPGQVTARAIIDTGAALTLLSSRVFERLPDNLRLELQPAQERFCLTAANGQPLPQKGVIDLPLATDGVQLKPLSFIVTDNLANDVLIGNDHLSQANLFGSINVPRGTIEYLGNGRSEIIHAKCEASTALKESREPTRPKQGQPLKVGTSPRPPTKKQPKARMTKANPNHAIGSVRILKSVTVPPRGEVTVPAAETKLRGIGHFRDSYVKPRQQRLGSKYKHPVIVAERYPGFKANVKIVHSLCDVSDKLLDGSLGIPLVLANSTNQAITLRANTKVAMAEAVDQDQLGSVNSIFPSDRTDPSLSSH